MRALGSSSAVEVWLGAMPEGLSRREIEIVVGAVPTQRKPSHPRSSSILRKNTKGDVHLPVRRGKSDRAVEKAPATALPAPGKRGPVLTKLQRAARIGIHENGIGRWV